MSKLPIKEIWPPKKDSGKHKYPTLHEVKVQEKISGYKKLIGEKKVENIILLFYYLINKAFLCNFIQEDKVDLSSLLKGGMDDKILASKEEEEEVAITSIGRKEEDDIINTNSNIKLNEAGKKISSNSVEDVVVVGGAEEEGDGGGGTSPSSCKKGRHARNASRHSRQVTDMSKLNDIATMINKSDDSTSLPLNTTSNSVTPTSTSPSSSSRYV